ncbi:hypothetical protein [Georgfuchsia toluolica]|nr:hypothetical protein [Georgfuchsia toluolica]
MTTGFIRRSWETPTIEQAEAIARKLSLAAIGDPIYPNLFFAVEINGTLRCHFFGGIREQSPMAA